MNPVLDAIFARRSVRKFNGESIAPDVLEVMVKAGMAAPSGRNQQPWSFIAVTDRAQLDALCRELPYAKMLDKAAGAICVCGDTNDKYWIEDCSAATQNILLACESLGYGAVWTAVHPTPERVESARRILSIPAEWVPLCVIPIGVPEGEHKPHDNFKKERLHWNRW